MVYPKGTKIKYLRPSSSYANKYFKIGKTYTITNEYKRFEVYKVEQNGKKSVGWSPHFIEDTNQFEKLPNKITNWRKRMVK